MEHSDRHTKAGYLSLCFSRMKLKIVNFVSAAVATLGLFVLKALAFSSDMTHRHADALIPQTIQSSQPSLVKPTDQSLGFVVEIFFTFAVIGFLAGCHFQYREYKKQRAKRNAKLLEEMETLELIEKNFSLANENIISQRKKRIETLERIWKMKP